MSTAGDHRDQRPTSLHPHIVIVDAATASVWPITSCPPARIVLVEDGAEVKAGDAAGEDAARVAKTRDITGGLPRVAELFEARQPKDPAVGHRNRRHRALRRHQARRAHGHRHATRTAMNREYAVPYGKHILVHDGDRVRAGERLTEGPLCRTTFCASRASRRCRNTW